jgi:hypothetical protein
VRAVKAIPDLINLLGFRSSYRWEGVSGPHIVRPTSVVHYPAREALIEIGKLALPALLEVVETRDLGSVESRNARYTIRGIFRDEQGKADEFLKEAAARASSPEAKRRLLKALETAYEDMKLNKEDM